MSVAIAQAAHDTLVAMFPSQRPSFDQEISAELAAQPTNHCHTFGLDLGHRAAPPILAVTLNSGTDPPTPPARPSLFTCHEP